MNQRFELPLPCQVRGYQAAAIEPNDWHCSSDRRSLLDHLVSIGRHSKLNPKEKQI